MADGVVSKWLKQVGDAVARGEPLFEVESDKVTTEVEAPAAGVLSQIKVPEGEKVDVGTVLAIIGSPGEVVSGGTSGASAVPQQPTTGKPNVIASAGQSATVAA